MRLLTTILFSCIFPSLCLAGAWPTERGTLKLSLSQFSQRHEFRLEAIPQNQKLHQDYTGLLVEYGLTDKLTLTGKLSNARYRVSGDRSQAQARQLGLMLDTPYLASGLLPPYLFQFTKSFLPDLKLHREKRASFHVGAFHKEGQRTAQRPDRHGHFQVIALADKIMTGRFHILQEAEIGQRRGSGTYENEGLYRFSLGYKAWQISAQSTRYEDETNGYVSLAHGYRLRWKPADGKVEIALGRGHERIGQTFFTNAKVFRGRLWSLEIQRRF